MDLVYENSVSAISVLQNGLHQQSHLMFAISKMFDPRYAFFFFSPLLYSLDKSAGKKLMWVTVIAEWSNQILKWMLHGERPYWWIHETEIYNKTQMPLVRQYGCTCETGPGSPSGHAMATAAVWYIIFETILQKKGFLPNNKLLNRIAWSVYTLMIAIVSLSRVYIAAHFPHQCLLGGIIGIAVARLITNLDLNQFKRSHYIQGSIGLLASALGTYVLLKLMGINPLWSVDRALKWCAKRENVHLDTTPFFSIMRYVGFFLGMGIALTSEKAKLLSKHKFSLPMKIIITILSLCASGALELIPLPKHIYILYLSGLIKSAILPYLFISIIPYYIYKINQFSTKKSD